MVCVEFLNLLMFVLLHSFICIIKRNCRHALVPQPTAAFVVRNFTSLAATYDEIDKIRSQIKNEEPVKSFQTVTLPDLDKIEEIDESFRQHLFAEWVSKNENKPRFRELKTKLHELTPKAAMTDKIYLNPTKTDEVTKLIGELITDIKVNTTFELHVVVPQDLRFALFEGWEEMGSKFGRLLYHYGNSRSQAACT